MQILLTLMLLSGPAAVVLYTVAIVSVRWAVAGSVLSAIAFISFLLLPALAPWR